MTSKLNKQPNAKCYLTIVAICFFAFFVNNNIIPADLMESRNLATAQEMLRTGNYLVPSMNGELRLEKPPLPTWIAAAVEHVLPDNLSAQRCAAAIAATMMTIFLFLLIFRLTKERLPALISAVVLATSYNIMIMARTATWDIYCHAFMLAAIYFMLCALDGKGRRWKYFISAGVFMGLSFLSKGPVAFYALLLPFLVSYGFVVRPKIKGKIVPVFVMIFVCLVISFWWPVCIAIFHPEAGMAVANKESANWLNHNVRPLWYYWKFAAEAGIWALFWITSLIFFFWKNKSEHRVVFKFSVVWTISAFILLSIIPEKKTRYLLPLIVPGAINIAFYICHSIKKLNTRNERIIFRINGIIIAIIAAGLPIFLYFTFVKKQIIALPIFILISLVFAAIAVYILISLYNKKEISPTKTFVGVVFTMLAFATLCFAPAGKLFINQNRHSIYALRHDSRIEGLQLYQDIEEEIRMELVYEANRNIKAIDLRNDSVFYASLPLVLLSTESIQDILTDKNVDIEYIDTFDNNWRKPESKRYNKNLVKQVAIIRFANNE